ncbi:MAG: benzoate-CoA ligase family protein [Nannocystaceae bacterium]
MRETAEPTDDPHFAETFNIADYFLENRVREGLGSRKAVRTDARDYTYAEILTLANRFGAVLRDAGVRAEERVLLALPDGVEMVAAIFGTLKIGAVVVMVNPELTAEAFGYFLEYSRARVAVTSQHTDAAATLAACHTRHLLQTFVVDEPAFAARLAASDAALDTFPTHRDDAAIWLFTGGTTGKPKAVVQTHRSFAHSTERYAKRVLHYGPEDITLSVPKLYFGYATGSNLFFPFAVGASCVLLPERCTPELIFGAIARWRPTLLINVPTMINKMMLDPAAEGGDLSCLRVCTSAGEALPTTLHHDFKAKFDVEVIDGLGTAEMWHVFVTNRPGDVRPGSLGKAVEGFDVRVRDDKGQDVEQGEVGWLWVRGDSRAQQYWQQSEGTRRVFRGPWYLSGDIVRQDADGYFYYCGRGDDMLKISGKWLAPKELEDCLLAHPAVSDVAVVGVEDQAGLTKPCAFVIPSGVYEGPKAELQAELQAFARRELEPFKYPRNVVFMDALPRTHLGKVDRGKLRREYSG